MTEPLLPERLEELIAGYVLSNLSSQEAEELKQLMKEQPELAQEVARLQEVLEFIPLALPDVAPPQHLRSAILEIASDNKIGSKNPETSGQPNPLPITEIKRSRQRWSWIVGSAAALLALALGLDNYRIRQQMTTLEAQVARQKDVIAMLQQPNTHLVSLKGMDQAAAASGSIVVTPGEPKAVLILQNLPVLPKGQFYQLWSIVNNEKIPWEAFNTGERGTVFIKLSLPTNSEVTALVVTVETVPAPRTPAGPMVMTGTL